MPCHAATRRPPRTGRSTSRQREGLYLALAVCLALQKGIGPAGWTPHWFRHSHASALLLAGTPEWVVSRRLGHAHVQTTVNLYGWVREDDELRAAANWASYASS